MNDWEPAIGLEVHVQLATHSKIFSGTSTAFGAAPNTQANAVDLGLPGVLPVLNEAAVRMAVTFGLAIGAEVNRRSVFDRKNYFYPDLPKGYQISQFEHPIVGPGHLRITMEDGSARDIGITRAHLEEDAGKSVHDAIPGMTGVDLNRTGTPLLEVVSDPDLRTAEEAGAYFRTLHALVKALRICDGDLSQGSMRCDANVSVRKTGDEKLGERTEIKNINSFRFVELAVRHEIGRQIDILEAGGAIERETRQFDADEGVTRPMRTKEYSEDYRYFPDPDLLPVEVTDELIDSIRASMPELPEVRAGRYRDELALSAYDAGRLAADPDVADYFDAVYAVCGEAKLSANWILGELAASLNRDTLSIEDSPVPASQLGLLISRVADDTLSNSAASTVFATLWSAGEGDVDEIIAAQGLRQMNDSSALEQVVAEVLTNHPEQAAQFRDGKEKILGFLVGQVMKATQGKANPRQVNELLREALK
ncbi:MAG: Asp-tRNA(Asn)/Glu-tRNA(Gln) amidotransferase subunit GatB [Pseudomonadales bacterium]|jgi:aspartyl-tRNA(Asn)/glutamyl-tRNA(Gln) amidotransferase subunit B|nr:Asp-tRNA(Asn)/Glu-tRNA(Gln) amidotransferase subunit GatB [Pseudomonadales bacterium]MDP6470825.1 Asp-tRNA(Asn)/Glu-tRNA(Gln) amidotransferase subunit GatB [Pseudomonadales bacterium]MDP6825990.1 Asp-tRNA(Asn)/Glu-tRNA(Gln) amidotransferase subunit GatB [Pseudomonadales bacterium]MDP6972302.1 Asp-tRNA(Asn)/Glu-tRNA(Gln) amidotransferase subunit GatB [Pseudomonadales bacterium]